METLATQATLPVVSFLLRMATLSRMLENSERANASTRYRQQPWTRSIWNKTLEIQFLALSVKVNHVLDGRLVFPKQALIDGSHVISVEMHSKYKKNVGAP